MSGNVDERPLSEENLQAARSVLERLSDLEGMNYQQALEFLAPLHRDKGASQFELRFGLRPPNNAAEELEVGYMAGKLTQEEFKLFSDVHCHLFFPLCLRLSKPLTTGHTEPHFG